jgi:hypothetical protein
MARAIASKPAPVGCASEASISWYRSISVRVSAVLRLSPSIALRS